VFDALTPELNALTSDPEIAARAVIKPECMDEFSCVATGES